MTRDYDTWHDAYDDAESTMSWRLGVVRSRIQEFLDTTPGPVRVLSLCSGDGRDLLGVLGERDDAARVSATLVELHPGLADRARHDAAVAAPAATVEVRTADAGAVDSFADVVPADLVLLVGIFGNVSDTDLAATIGAVPGLCAPGATVLWTRGRGGTELGDLDAEVRAWFATAGTTETFHETLERGSRPTVGEVRMDGPVAAVAPGAHLFTFIR